MENIKVLRPQDAIHILELEKNVEISVSVTTRPMRENEVDGVDYHFVDDKKFREMAENGEFLEYVSKDKHYIGYSYGTPQAPVEKVLSEGKDILFDIEGLGTRQIVAAMPKDVVTIFILPPSWQALEERLQNRDKGEEDEVARRMARAQIELGHWGEYYYIVVNHDIEDSTRRVQAILEAERMRRSRLEGLADFVEELKPPG